MKFPRVSLGAFCAALLLTPPALAGWRAIQSRDVARELFVVDGADGPEIRDGGASVRLEPPPGVILQRLEALGDGWIVAGARRANGETSLWLATGSDGAPEPTPPPAVDGRYLNAPVPLIEHGGLVGLAWLEGERHDAMAVRAAAWSGRGWDDPVTVSPPDLQSQLALAGAVLPDGSWQLVWSAIDGGDDEIYSARRAVGGYWEPRRQLNAANDVPDIHPQIVATGEGSLIAWNELHDGHYRVRLVRLDLLGRERISHVAAAGTVSPRLLTSGGLGLLLYKDVLAERWTALEVDAGGSPLRKALAPISNRPSPVVVSRGDALTFRWTGFTAEGPPAAAAAQTSELEVPWQAFEPESLDDRPDSTRAAGGADGTPPQFGAGTVLYRAFGDSVSRGHAKPFFPTIVFDKVEPGETGTAGPACIDALPFSVLCGYNWRLESLVANSDVANDGLPGETTANGLTRVDGVLAGSGDVLLAMEGSNDLTFCGTSTTTVRDNIGLIVDKATVAGFDSVIASVAKRRRLDAMSNVVADPCGEDAATLDLHNKLNALATLKNRAFTDVYNSIDPALGFTDYWNGCGVESCTQPDVVGHPDASGYDKIAPKFSTVILADSMLGAPSPIGPAGDVTSSPTFEWNELAGARLYRLSVTGPGAPADSWHDSLTICTASVCSVNLAPLTGWSYTWKVAGKNLRGLGAFSGDLAFAFVPSPYTPQGDTFDDTPTYRWSDVDQADNFTLEVTGAGGFSQDYSASTYCSGGLCEVTPAGALDIGAYTWRVRGKNTSGTGDYSATVAFEVLDCTPPASLELDASNTGSMTYRACPGTVTSKAGFVIANGEVVTLHGKAGVVIEEIEVESGATATFLSN